jgi:NAD(P)H dehydrogenase (quinone)
MYQSTKVVIFYVGAIESLHRTAVSVCEALWDAGAELRVRRVGEIDAIETPRANADRAELLRELEEIPPAEPEDLEWADVALFGISPRDGAIPRAFGRLVEDANGRCRDELADKLYCVLSPEKFGAAAPEGSLLPLSDLFNRCDGGGEAA